MASFHSRAFALVLVVVAKAHRGKEKENGVWLLSSLADVYDIGYHHFLQRDEEERCTPSLLGVESRLMSLSSTTANASSILLLLLVFVLLVLLIAASRFMPVASFLGFSRSPPSIDLIGDFKSQFFPFEHDSDEDTVQDMRDGEKREPRMSTEENDLPEVVVFPDNYQWTLPRDATACSLPHACAPVYHHIDHWDDDFAHGLHVTSQPNKLNCASHTKLSGKLPGNQTDPEPVPWTVSSIRAIFREHGIDDTAWDKKMLDKLMSSLASGDAQLMVTPEGELVRTWSLCQVLVYHPSSHRILCASDAADASAQSWSLAHASEFRKKMKQDAALPTTHIKTLENCLEAAVRCISEKLGLPDEIIKFHKSGIISVDAIETNAIFPGLTSQVRKLLVQGCIDASDEEIAEILKQSTNESVSGPADTQCHTASSTFDEEDEGWKWVTECRGERHQWVWRSVDEVTQIAELLEWSASRGFFANQKKSESLLRDADLRSVVPWSQADVESLLGKHNAAAANFGMSSADLASQASQGLIFFGKRRSDGQLVAIQDMVSLRVVSPFGQAVLVDHKNEPHWPTSIRRLDESPWETARRLARTQLGVEESALCIEVEPLEVPPDNGTSVIVRMWVVSAQLGAGFVSRPLITAQPANLMSKRNAAALKFLDKSRPALSFPDQFKWMIPGDTSLPHACASLPDEKSMLCNDARQNVSTNQRSSVRALMFEAQTNSGRNANDLDVIPAPWSPQALVKILEKHSINTEAWNANMIQKLCMACQEGKSFLMVSPEGKLMRTWELVHVVVVHPSLSMLLVSDEAGHKYAESASAYRKKMKDSDERLPTTRRQLNESTLQAALRCVHEKLGLPSSVVDLHFGGTFANDNEEIKNDIYPGLPTLVRREFVQAVISASDEEIEQALDQNSEPTPENVKTEGQFAEDSDEWKWTIECRGEMHQWVWKDFLTIPRMCLDFSWIKQGAKLGSNLIYEAEVLTRDADLQVVMPWSKEDVEAQLTEYGMHASAFGMSSEELASKASSGHWYFGFRRSDKKMVCVKDTICLRVVSPDDQEVLVQTTPLSSTEEQRGSVQWPCSIRRLDESAWDTARRVARTQLKMEDTSLHICHDPNAVEENGNGSLFVDRKWVLTASIPEGQEHLYKAQSAQR